jgi:hypothetical protein
MIRWLALAALLLSTAPAAAQNIVAIDESKGDYSVCSANAQDMEACARNDCEKISAGDQPCEIVLVCPFGWLAIAITDDTDYGVGFSCGDSSDYGSKVLALAACAKATNRDCHVRGVIDPDGAWIEEEAGRGFEAVVLTQVALTLLGYYKDGTDGRMGPVTRAAIRDWQGEMEYAETGRVEDNLHELIADAGGTQAMIDGLIAIHDSIPAEYRELMYGFSRSPKTRQHRAAEYVAMDVDLRDRALGAIVNFEYDDCTGAAAEQSSDTSWMVLCSEGPYLLSFAEDGNVDVRPFQTSTYLVRGSGTRAPIPL